MIVLSDVSARPGNPITAGPDRQPRQIAAALAFGLIGALACVAAVAQALPPPSGGPYVMRKQVIAGGGQHASGGSYVMTGTLGQVAIDPNPAAGAAYRLAGGFHNALSPRTDSMFVDGFEN